MKSNHGFTLLETMIAMAIMMVAFSAILMVESASINSTEKAKQMNVVAMLAKNKMIESEFETEGKAFEEIKTEDAGQFKEPFLDYSWKREIKEIEFPDFASGTGTGDDPSGANAQAEQLGKQMSKFLSQAIREITVTITWKRGSGTQHFSVSSYWVDLNHAFQL